MRCLAWYQWYATSNQNVSPNCELSCTISLLLQRWVNSTATKGALLLIKRGIFTNLSLHSLSGDHSSQCSNNDLPCCCQVGSETSKVQLNNLLCGCNLQGLSISWLEHKHFFFFCFCHFRIANFNYLTKIWASALNIKKQLCGLCFRLAYKCSSYTLQVFSSFVSEVVCAPKTHSVKMT